MADRHSKGTTDHDGDGSMGGSRKSARTTNDQDTSKPVTTSGSKEVQNRATNSTGKSKEPETDAVKAINDGSANAITQRTPEAARDARIENPDDPTPREVKDTGNGTKVALPPGIYEKKGRLYNSRGGDVTTDANTRLGLTG